MIPIHHEKLVKVFEYEGFTIKRKRGDHIIMTKPGVYRPVVIKSSPKTVPVTHISTNLKTAGMSRVRFFDVLALIS